MGSGVPRRLPRKEADPCSSRGIRRCSHSARTPPDRRAQVRPTGPAVGGRPPAPRPTRAAPRSAHRAPCPRPALSPPFNAGNLANSRGSAAETVCRIAASVPVLTGAPRRAPRRTPAPPATDALVPTAWVARRSARPLLPSPDPLAPETQRHSGFSKQATLYGRQA